MKTIIQILIAFLPLGLIGQDTKLDKREILVEKEYDNTIYESNPIFNYASINVPRGSRMKLSFDSLSSINYNTPDIDISIRPVAYKSLTKQEGHKGFIKLDKGTVNPLHAQGGYVFSAPNYFNLSGNFKYDKRNDQRTMNMMTQTAGGSLDLDYYLTKSLKTSFSVGYDQDKFGLYGAQNIMTDLEEGENHSFQLVQINLGLETFNVSPKPWNFAFWGHINEWKQEEINEKENNIDLLGKVDFKISEKWSILAAPSFKTSLNNRINDTQVLTGNLQVAFNTSNFFAKVGAVTNYFNDNVNIWPDLDVRWNLGHHTALNITSTATANIQNGQYLSSFNPYAAIDLVREDFGRVALQKNARVEVASNINESSRVNFVASFLDATDDLNFKRAGTRPNTFDVENVDYQRLRVGVGYTYQVNDLLQAGLQIQHDNYAEATSTLFNRPTLTITPNVNVTLLDNKLNIGVNGYINNPQQFDVYPALSIESGWRKNLSFEVKYRLLKNLNLYFNADNVIDDDYQVWNGYNNFGRNLSGGAMFKF